MSLKNLGRGAALLVAGLLVAAGSLEAKPWWWEKHFDGDRYSPLHYWLPGVYRLRAYCHPVPFEPLSDGPVQTSQIPAPKELEMNQPPATPGRPKNDLPPMPPAK